MHDNVIPIITRRNNSRIEISIKEKRTTRQVLIDLAESLVMEDLEEKSPVEAPKYANQTKSHKPPVTRYEKILYNRGSSVLMLPEKMVMPGGVDDIALYPSTEKKDDIQDGFYDGFKQYFKNSK